MGNNTSATKEALPIDTSFKLPSPLPSLPQGEGFGNGVINLGGGLQVCQIVSLSKIWATNEGGPGNLGATFFEPEQVPQGFSMLGCYSQPNNRMLHGWVLAGKDDTVDPCRSSKKVSATFGCLLLPAGYKALGCVVTTSPEKPSLEKVRCARSDLTDECQADKWIWGQGKESDPNGFNVFSLRPSSRGAQAMGVSAGTFSKQYSRPTLLGYISIPDEEYLPSSASWYFTNGALLYKKDEESTPAPIEPTGSSLPQGGSNDGLYWLDLPMEEAERERVKRGDLQSCHVYLQIKPMLGATFTDIVAWLFYPFNGPSRAKVDLINVPLGKTGQHVGDWEHATLRISNFNGQLRAIYLSAHSGGAWYDASELEFQSGNRAVAYSSLNGHAMYAKPGLVLQGSGNIGIRNDTAKSEKFIDTGARFSVVAAEYMGSSIIEPPWLNYLRKWGPNITYDIAEEVATVENLLPGKLKSAFDKVVKSLPREIFGEEGPTGPKLKRNWIGDEV
ncbi:F1C9.34 PROTEIN [Salix viminalis]|uniref:F1C9.34 PROTEIN n=1 Tax=Salix viminalis TaxID=40686 RepID=A0A9Q0NPJ3_SALVM|nr:F1C9.34 PROTEIN [Salix viminalis]